MNDTDTRDWRELQVLVRPSSVSDYQMFADADISYGVGATTYGKIYAGIDGNGVAHSVNHDGTAYGDIYAEGNVTGAVHDDERRAEVQTRRTIRIDHQVADQLQQLPRLARRHPQRGAARAASSRTTPTVDAWKMTFQSNGQVFVQSCMKVVRQADRRRARRPAARARR